MLLPTVSLLHIVESQSLSQYPNSFTISYLFVLLDWLNNQLLGKVMCLGTKYKGRVGMVQNRIIRTGRGGPLQTSVNYDTLHCLLCLCWKLGCIIAYNIVLVDPHRPGLSFMGYEVSVLSWTLIGKTLYLAKIAHDHWKHTVSVHLLPSHRVIMMINIFFHN